MGVVPATSDPSRGDHRHRHAPPAVGAESRRIERAPASRTVGRGSAAARAVGVLVGGTSGHGGGPVMREDRSSGRTGHEGGPAMRPGHWVQVSVGERRGRCQANRPVLLLAHARGGSDRSGQGADRHAKVLEHLQVLVGRTAERRQVVAHDERVDPGCHADGLEVSEGHLVFAGVAQVSPREGPGGRARSSGGLPRRPGRDDPRGGSRAGD